MAKPIVLCADSSCDLSPELIEQYNVHILPLHIVLDGECLLDGVDVCRDDVYRVYNEKKILPKTTAINIQEYIDFLKPFTDAGNDVILISLGSALSTTYNNGRLAAEELPGVYLIDSANLSSGFGLLVLETADRIAAGMPVEQIVEEVTDLTKRVESSFVLSNLEFLHKGGRCSTLAMMGANVLKLNPCIEVNSADGSMTVGKKYRGSYDGALKQYVQDRLLNRDDIDPHRIFITNSGMPQERIDMVSETVRECFTFEETLYGEAGCTISSHCGPNTLGILFIRKA